MAVGPSDWFDGDEALAAQVHRANAPPHLRAVLARIPTVLALVVERPAGSSSDCPLVAAQLLKLALSTPTLELGPARRGRDWAIEVRRGTRQIRLTAPELRAATLASAVEEALHATLDPQERFAVLEVFARQEVLLDSLHTITRHMLQATDVDIALAIMLGGVTSGHGLGFHRAVLFLWDEAGGAYVGDKAVGPADDAEAHRIWEAIETEDRTIESLIEDASRANVDTRLQRRVQGLAMKPISNEDDELSKLEHGGVSFIERRIPVQPALRALDAAPTFALAEIRAHGRCLGLLFADNAFGDTTISAHQRQSFGLFIAQTALVWENLSLLAHVEYLARRDPLTGLLNRRAFDACLATAHGELARHDSPLGLILVDVDHFKEINDTRGHEGGDEVLCTFAEILRGALGPNDTASRWGGDEFAVLLSEASTSRMREFTQRVGAEAKAAGIGLSMGGVRAPEDVRALSELVGAADAALYMSKRAGRGRASFVSGSAVVF